MSVCIILCSFIQTVAQHVDDIPLLESIVICLTRLMPLLEQVSLQLQNVSHFNSHVPAYRVW